MRIKEECKVRTVAGEHLLLIQGVRGLQATRIIVLNDVGAWLFNRAKSSTFTQTELVNEIIDRYEVDLSTAFRDVQQWVNQLAEIGIIEE